MFAVALALAFWSRSKNYIIAALVVAIDWSLTNFLITNYGLRGINVVAPMTFIFLVVFWFLKNNQTLNGRVIYSILYWLYCLYMAVYGWHLAMRFAFPNSWAATYLYAAIAANAVFWVVCISIMAFGLMKGIDNRVKGGLPTLLDRWASKRKKKA